MKKFFSFFNFYYNVIKGSPKKYDIAMEHPDGFIAIITPLFMFILSMPIFFFIPPSFLPLMYLWIPIIIGNFGFVHSVSKKGYEIQREEQRKRDELERQERERQRRERMRREEEERRRRLEEEERIWQEFLRRHFERQQRQQQRHQYHQQRQQQSSSQNRANAMRLLGLSEGFTEKDVKKAYRRLSKIHHPDMGGTQENFIRLNKAYNYLMQS